MTRRTCGILAALIALAIPASATAGPAKWFEADYKLDYLKTYPKCWDAFAEDCGANLVDDHPNIARAKVEEADARMEAWLNPPPAPEPEPVEEAAPVEASYAEPVYSGGAGGSTVQCESGGDYNVYDPTGTYWGGWQFDQQTWDAYNVAGGEWGSATPAQQDAAAAAVPYDAWPNC